MYTVQFTQKAFECFDEFYSVSFTVTLFLGREARERGGKEAGGRGGMRN